MRAGPRRRSLRERRCQLARAGLANTILERVAFEESAARAAARQRAGRRARNRAERFVGVPDTEGISIGLVAEPEPDPFADLPDLVPGSSSSSDSGGEGEGEPNWVREPCGVPRGLWPTPDQDSLPLLGLEPALTEAEFAECVPRLSGEPAPAPLPVGHAFGFVDTSLDVAGAFLRHTPREPRHLEDYRPGLAAQREFASVSDRWLAERAVPDLAATAERAAQLGVHLSACELEAEAAAELAHRYGSSTRGARPTRTAECPGPQGPPPPYVPLVYAELASGLPGTPIPQPLSEEEYRASLPLPFGSHRASVRAVPPVFCARPVTDRAPPGLGDPGAATAEVLRIQAAAVLAELRAPHVRAGLRRLELLEAISLQLEDRSLEALSAILDVLVTMQDYGQRG